MWVRVADFLWTNAIALVALVISSVSVFVAYYNPKFVEKRHERKEKPSSHFKELTECSLDDEGEQKSVLLSILNITRTTKLSPSNGEVIYYYEQGDLWWPRKFVESHPFERIEMYDVFAGHYPTEEIKWVTIKEKILQNNKRALSFKAQVTEVIKSLHELPSMKVITSATTEDTLSSEAIKLIAEELFRRASQQKTDTSNWGSLNIIPKNDSCRVILKGRAFEHWLAYIKTMEKAELYRLMLQSVLDNQILKQDAEAIMKSARQLERDADVLYWRLDNIRLYGLSTRRGKYRFKPTRGCPVCDELFF